MKVSCTSWKLAAFALLAWPLMDAAALAQRGERGGGGGDRGSARSGGGGGDRGGGGRSFSGGSSRSFSGNNSGRSFSSSGRSRDARPTSRSQNFSGSRGPSSRDGTGSGRAWSPERSTGQFNRGAGALNRGQAERGPSGQQRSFYRGPGDADGQRTMTRDFDGRQRDPQTRDRSDFDRDRNQFSRDRDNQFNRDRDQIDRGERNRGDQIARDREDDRDRGAFDRDGNRGDRDRSWDRANWDRNDWNRFGGSRSGWGWGGDNIRRSWWNYGWGGNMPFSYGWWDPYYGAGWPVYSPFRYSRWQNRPYYWYTWTPAARLGSALVFGWDRPRYWGYGPGANIYYEDNYVYYDGRRTVPINDYYQQVYDLAHSVPEISASQGEQLNWNPLGVFALQRANEQQSTRAMQLAVSDNGVITGTYFNRDRDEVHPLSGMVDERTQRAAWAFADGQQKSLVFETGIYNLTRDESTMMVHFGPSEQDTEVWQLVRLEQPDAERASGTRSQTQLP